MYVSSVRAEPKSQGSGKGDSEQLLGMVLLLATTYSC